MLNHTNIEISIIIPVYNVEPFVVECLDSILYQEFAHQYEVLLVNDASSDKSGIICRDFAGRFPKIFRYFEHEENQGVSAARNLGLGIARGRYIMFVDPDDTLPVDALRAMHDTAESYSVDIVKGNHLIFDGLSTYEAKFNVKEQAVMRDDGPLLTLLRHEKMRGHPWGKLFRRHVALSARFEPGIRIAEDLLYCAEVFAAADSLLLSKDTVYIHRVHQKSVMAKKYETNSYLNFLDSVESIGAFATDKTKKLHHRGLMIRTLLKMAKECDLLPYGLAKPALSQLEARKRKWDLNGYQMLLRNWDSLPYCAKLYRLERSLRRLRRRCA